LDTRRQIQQSRSPVNCRKKLQASKCQATLEEVNAAS
jgi:hypothetical protein